MSRTDPYTIGLVNRSPREIADHSARLAIRERTPGVGSSTVTTVIDATLPIGSGTEVTQEDVDAIGIKQAGTDDATLRILPAAGFKSSVLFYDGSTSKWELRKETDNRFKLIGPFSKTPFNILAASGSTGGPITSLTGKFTNYGGPTADYNNTIFDVAGQVNCDPAYLEASSTGANRTRWDAWVTAGHAIGTAPTSGVAGGTNGLRHARSGTISYVQSTRVVTSSAALFSAGDVGKKIQAITTSGTTVAYYTGKIATFTDTTHVTLDSTDNFGVDLTTVSYAVDPDDISFGSASTGWGNQYSTFPSMFKLQSWHKGYGSFNPIQVIVNADDSTITTPVSIGAGSDGYCETAYFAGHGVCNRAGALVGGEVGLTVSSGKRGRCSPWWTIITDANTYASYNVSDMGSTSPWKQTGSRGMWIYSGSSTIGAGTGLWISNRPSSAWKRAIVYNDGSTEDLTGTDLFTVAGGTGYVGIGASAGIHHTLNNAGLDAALLIAPSDTPTTAGEGIMLGTLTNSPVKMYRSGTDNLHITSSVSIAGGLVNVSGGRVFAGSLSMNMQTKTANYTMVSTDGGILADTTSGNVTITLPPATTSGQLVEIFKTVAANTLTVQRAGSDTVEGATSLTFTGQYDRIKLRADGGTTWYRVLQNPGQFNAMGIGAATAIGGGAAGIFMNSGGQIDMVNPSGAQIRNYAAAGDTQNIWGIRATGEYRVGVGGSTAPDAGLERSATNTITITKGSTGTTGILRAESQNVVGTAGAGYLQFTEQSSQVAAGTADTRVRMYMKADKVVFVFDNAGTVRYFTLDLTQTGATATWAQSTTGP